MMDDQSFGDPSIISLYFPDYSNILIPLSFSALCTLKFLYAGKLRKQAQMNKEYSKMKSQPSNEHDIL